MIACFKSYNCLQEDGSTHRCAHFLQQLARNQPPNSNDIIHPKMGMAVAPPALCVLLMSRLRAGAKSLCSLLRLWKLLQHQYFDQKSLLEKLTPNIRLLNEVGLIFMGTGWCRYSRTGVGIR